VDYLTSLSHDRDLIDCQCILAENIVPYCTGTRDTTHVKTYQDSVSKVIFNDHVPNVIEYREGRYRHVIKDQLDKDVLNHDYDSQLDVARRKSDFLQMIVNRDIIDYGCGRGKFLIEVNGISHSTRGIELEEEASAVLRPYGIICSASLSDVAACSVDTVFMFHSFEHLSNPLETLRGVRRVLRPGGYIVLEVPNSRDILLERYKSSSFRNFTLWSQHLILHAQQSISNMLRFAGYREILTKGIQRYGLANHLNWLIDNKPSGQSSGLHLLFSDDVELAYGKSLKEIGMSDTLYATARNPQ
jgi:SAM-dependent methyltransferase